MMGDHLCGGAGPAANTFMPLGNSVHDKIGAIPPVDTAMASESRLLCLRQLGRIILIILLQIEAIRVNH